MKRRSFLTLLTGIIAAPAIVKIANIMPVKVWVEPEVFEPGTILGSSKHLNGFLHEARYIPRRVTNSELLALCNSEQFFQHSVYDAQGNHLGAGLASCRAGFVTNADDFRKKMEGMFPGAVESRFVHIGTHIECSVEKPFIMRG